MFVCRVTLRPWSSENWASPITLLEILSPQQVGMHILLHRRASPLPLSGHRILSSYTSKAKLNLVARGWPGVLRPLLTTGHLRELDIARCNLRSSGVVALTTCVLKATVVLDVLNLSDNQVGAKGCRGLARLVSRGGGEGRGGLRVLTLRKCGLCTGPGGMQGFGDLCEALSREDSRVQNLDLSENNLAASHLDGAAVEALAYMLSRATALEHLWLESTPMEPMDIQFLAASLRHQARLRRLSLAACRLGDRGIEAFVNSFLGSLTVAS